MIPITSFLSGATAMGFWIAGLFFFRFWRKSGDRLFAIFGLAFWAMMAERIVLVFFFKGPTTEEQFYIYLFRLAAFAMIVCGIIDKNKRQQ